MGILSISAAFSLSPSSATAQEENSPSNAGVPVAGAVIATEEARLVELIEKKGDFDFLYSSEGQTAVDPL